MMKSNHRFCLSLFRASCVSIVVAVLQGCSSIPISFNPNLVEGALATQDIPFLTVLPILEMRDDRKESFDLAKVDVKFKPWLKENLTKMGYKVEFQDTQSLDSIYTLQDLVTPSTNWLNQLAGQEKRWVLVYVLNELQATENDGFRSRCSAYLIHSFDAKHWWHHATYFDYSKVMFDFMVKSRIKEGVVQGCMEMLTTQLPVKSTLNQAAVKWKRSYHGMSRWIE